MEMSQPQDIMQDIEMNGPNQLNKFLKLGIYTYQEIFEFLTPRDFQQITGLCRRFSDKFPLPRKPLPKYEIIWKKMCQRDLMFC